MATELEINRAARAVASTVYQKTEPLRVAIGELFPVGARNMVNHTKNRYPGLQAAVCAVLVAHPNGMYAADLYGKVKEEFPELPSKQVLYNMLSQLQRKGNVINLGKGTGMWGPGKVPYGKVKRRYRKRTHTEPAQARATTGSAEAISQTDADMIIQNLRVSLVDLDKLLFYVQQQMEAVAAARKLLAGL